MLSPSAALMWSPAGFFMSPAAIWDLLSFQAHTQSTEDFPVVMADRLLED